MQITLTCVNKLKGRDLYANLKDLNICGLELIVYLGGFGPSFLLGRNNMY